MKKRLLLLFALIFSITCLYGDSIRGNSTSVIKSGREPGEEITFRMNDLVAIDMEDNRFIEGIELIFSLPGEFIQYRDSFALTIYSDINTYPEKNRTSYYGKKIFFTPLPPVTKMYVDIPVKAMPQEKPPFGTFILKKKVPESSFPLIIKIEPVMKGIPSSLLSKTFKLKTRNIMIQKGALSISIDRKGHNGSSYRIEIDNHSIESPENLPLLKPGIHQLNIYSDYFREYTTKFAIKAGQTTTISVELEPYNPTVQFDFPEDAKSFLDGEKLEFTPGEKTSITPGEHVISITIGDYTISKKFTVKKDKFYKISLFLDIFIKEN